MSQIFEDMTEDDSYDPSPADPMAVARFFVDLERFVTGDPHRKIFDELSEEERAMLVFAFFYLLARLKREGF